MTLRIGQLNTRNGEVAWHLLERAAWKQQLDVVLVQDLPHRAKKGKLQWQGFRLYLPSVEDPQVGIMVRDTIEVMAGDSISDRVFGVSVRALGGALFCASAYIQHTSGLGSDDLEILLTRMKSRFSRIFLGMDSNGHSLLWGPAAQGSNVIGQRVEDVLGGQGMEVLNSPTSEATFVSDSGCKAWIDVSAASPGLARRLLRWHVDLRTEVCSDHHLLISEFAEGTVRGPVRITRNWKGADWARFRAKLQSELDSRRELEGVPHDGESLELATEAFHEGFQSVIGAEVPTKRLCSLSKAWWTPEIQRLHTTLQSVRRRWKRTGDGRDWAALVEARRTFRGRVRGAKQEAWQKFCQETSTSDYWSLYKRVTSTRGPVTVDDLKIGDRWVRSDAEKVSVLAEAFFPKLQPGPALDLHNSVLMCAETRDDQFSVVTPAEVHSAIQRIRPGKAPGFDEIPGECLKQCSDIVVPFLVRLFTASLRCHHFPAKWKAARVLALRKPGKGTYSAAKSYRPISLLSIVGKMLEAIVNRRIMRQIDAKLSPFQFGFRRGRSTIDAGWRLVDEISGALRSRRQTQAVTLDIKSAYDTVWHEGLLHKMRQLKIDDVYIQWVKSYLEGRQCTLKVGNAEFVAEPDCGLPQGSALSPTLFLIFINDILRTLASLEDIKFQAFADDLILWIIGCFQQGIVHFNLQAALDKISEWSHQWRLKFSVEKCIGVCFAGRLTKIEKEFRAVLSGQPIPMAPSFRYLGLEVDRCLSWKQHIEGAVCKALGRLYRLRLAMRQNWGLDSVLFLRIVRGAIIPALFYGAECWANMLGIESRLGRLDRVLGMAGRMAYGLESSTSTEAALTLANLMPSRLQIVKRLCRYMARSQIEGREPFADSRQTRHYIIPAEVGRCWLRKAVKAADIRDPQSLRLAILDELVDRQLSAAWRREWQHSDKGALLREVLPSAGTEWTPEGRTHRAGTTLLARMMTGHCHLGGVRIQAHEERPVECPLCGDFFTRDHIVFECTAVEDLRMTLLQSVPQVHRRDLEWIVRGGQRAFLSFLGGVGERVMERARRTAE